jgi:hypothetical protein
MPYWTPEEEKSLVSMAETGKTIEEICECFHRSPEAIKLKLRRLGTAVIPLGQKEVNTTRTSQQTLEPLKPTDDLISMEEALQMWLAVVKRLNEPGITGLELKRLRLILMSLKGYAVVQADYYLRLRALEEEIKELHEHIVEDCEQERDRATTDEERAERQRKIDDMEKDKEWDSPHDYHVWARRVEIREPGVLLSGRRRRT